MWFGKKSEAKNASNAQGSALENVQRFLSDYERVGKDRTRYAMALWGISEAFLKIFGSFDGYHGADKAKRNRYLTMIANNAMESLESDNEILANCNQAFVNFLVATEGYSGRQLGGRSKMSLIASTASSALAKRRLTALAGWRAKSKNS